MRTMTFVALLLVLLLSPIVSTAQQPSSSQEPNHDGRQGGQDADEDTIWVDFGNLPLPVQDGDFVLALDEAHGSALLRLSELENRFCELAEKLPRLLGFVSSITGDFEVAQIELSVGIGAQGEATVFFISGEYSTNAGIKLVLRRVSRTTEAVRRTSQPSRPARETCS